MRLLDYLDEVYLSQRDISTATEAHYRSTLEMFGRWLGRDAVLTDLTTASVNAYLKHVQDSGRSKATVNSKRRDLLAIWRSAWEASYTDEHPRGVRRLKIPDRIPCSWSPLEIKRLLGAAESLDVYFPNGAKQSDFWCGFIGVSYDSGLRLGDTLSLKWSAIDKQTGVIAVVQEKSSRRHAVRVRPSTLTTLKRMPHPDDRALPYPYCKSSFWDAWRRLLKSADLPSGRRQGPQKLRRSSATELARVAGEEAAASHLGHSRNSVGLARKNYLGVRAYPPPPLPPEVG